MQIYGWTGKQWADKPSTLWAELNWKTFWLSWSLKLWGNGNWKKKKLKKKINNLRKTTLPVRRHICSSVSDFLLYLVKSSLRQRKAKIIGCHLALHYATYLVLYLFNSFIYLFFISIPIKWCQSNVMEKRTCFNHGETRECVRVEKTSEGAGRWTQS